jgi:hypothetical protein
MINITGALFAITLSQAYSLPVGCLIGKRQTNPSGIVKVGSDKIINGNVADMVL